MSEQTLLKSMELSKACFQEYGEPLLEFYPEDVYEEKAGGKAGDHGPVRPIQLWQVRSDAGATRSGHGSAAQPVTIMSANVKRFI